MSDAGGSPMARKEDFEIVAKSARVEIDLNSRDARLARLADDPFLLRSALTERNDQARQYNGHALAPAASAAVAVIVGMEQPGWSDLKRKNRSSMDTGISEHFTGHVQYYHADEDTIPPSSPAFTYDVIQFVLLSFCIFSFLALAAFLLFAA